jgi:hypothetical protein
MTIMNKASVAASLAFLLFPMAIRGQDAGIPKQPDPDSTIRLVTREEAITYLEDGADPKTLAVSRDAKRVAYWVRRQDKVRVVADGVAGQEFDRYPMHLGMVIGGPIVFSPNSKRIGYVAMRGNNMCVVVDRKAGKEYGTVKNLTFSPDSKGFAYAAKGNRGWTVIVGAVEGKGYRVGAGPPVYSPDGKRLAYAARADNAGATPCRVVVDGKESRPCGPISHLGFSTDGKLLVCAGENVFLDGRKLGVPGTHNLSVDKNVGVGRMPVWRASHESSCPASRTTSPSAATAARRRSSATKITKRIWT